MTKRRLPLTFENALTKVAGVIGWAVAARICGQAERTVRNWSEPDTSAAISLDAALALDVAFHAAGGDGSPFLSCYSTRVESNTLAACRGREALLNCIARVALESGEAVAATMSAALPDASDAHFVIAERELEESIATQTHALAALRLRRTAAAEDDLPAPLSLVGAK